MSSLTTHSPMQYLYLLLVQFNVDHLLVLHSDHSDSTDVNVEPADTPLDVVSDVWLSPPRRNSETQSSPKRTTLIKKR